MKLEGSCHCGKVEFSLTSPHPYPFNICYCGICRKTAGSGGFGINLGGEAKSLVVVGEEFIRVYRALVQSDGGTEEESPCERRFCGSCGSPLWIWDPRWPELIHPFASAIDTALPKPPERTHLMLGSKPDWVDAYNRGDDDRSFEEYPEESIAQWHERLKLSK